MINKTIALSLLLSTLACTTRYTKEDLEVQTIKKIKNEMGNHDNDSRVKYKVVRCMEMAEHGVVRTVDKEMLEIIVLARAAESLRQETGLEANRLYSLVGVNLERADGMLVKYCCGIAEYVSE